MAPPDGQPNDPFIVSSVSASSTGSSDAENRWMRFGLSTNPYFVEPLSADPHGPRPIDLFQGREKDAKEILDTIAGEQNSLILIEGPSGIGKSTFVNFVKHRLGKEYFAPANEIGVQSYTTADSLLLAVIDSAVRHASDLVPNAKWEKEFPAIHTARQMVLALRGIGWGYSAGIGIPGFANIGATKPSAVQPPIMGPVLTPSFFSELARDLMRITEPPCEGIIVHVNNLDTMVSASPKLATQLFSDLREYFQVTHIHWIFLGPPGLYADIVASERRLLPFVKASIDLEKLPAKDVDRLLEKRYEHYKLRNDWIRPTSPALVKALYDQFGGDLRGTLNALSLAHKVYVPVDAKSMSESDGISFLTGVYKKRLEKHLKGKTFHVLEFLIRIKKDEFTQDDVEPVEAHQSNRSVRFAEMENWDAIRLVRNDGARKVYTFGGAARIGFGL